MKRMLMITAAFPPSNSAGVHRTARFARMLPDFGWEPIVLTSTQLDGTPVPQWVESLNVERRRGWKRAAPQNGRRGKTAAASPGVAVESRTTSLTSGLKSILRNARDLVLETPDRDIGWVLPNLRHAVRMARACKVDAVYTSGPPHSLHLLGRHVKKRLQIPWLADFRDPWARRPWGPKERNPWGQRLSGRLESACVRTADRVILNTPRMADEFRTHYSTVSSERFLAIPNGCDPDLAVRVTELLQSQQSLAAVARQQPFRLCHPGSLYRQRDPRPIVDAIGLLRDRGVRVAFEQLGACESSFRLDDYIAARGLIDWVTILPPVPHDEALRHMAQADALLLVQPGTDLQVPGKLFEMLLFRKPIVALTDPGATVDIIEQYNLGVCIHGSDAGAIADALEHVARNTAASMATPAWDDACRDFDGRTLTMRLADALNLAVRHEAACVLEAAPSPICAANAVTR